MGIKTYLVIAAVLVWLLASLTVLQIFAFIAGGVLLFGLSELLATGPEDPQAKILRSALTGERIELAKVSAAYWGLYEQTKKPKSEWIVMSREEKSRCYKDREDLRELFSQFPKSTQNYILSERPK